MKLWPLVKSHQRMVWLTLLFGWATLAMGIGLQSTSSYLIARAATRPSTILLLWVPIVAVRFFGTGRGVTRYLDRLSAHDVTLTWLRDLRVAVYRAIEPLRNGERGMAHTGDWMLRMGADVDTLQNLFITLWEPILVGIASLGVVVFVGQLLSIKLALVIVAMLVFSGVILSWLADVSARRTSAHLIHLRSRLSTQILDSWHGIVDIVAMNQVGEVLRQVASLDESWISTKVRLHRLNGLFQGLSLLVTGMGLWLVLIQAIQLVDHHRLHPILLPVAALLTLAGFEIINPLPAAFLQRGQIMAAKQRLDVLVHTDAVRSPLSLSIDLAPHPTLSLDHVSLWYESSDSQALKDVSITLEPGVHVALVGPNGSGKSSMLDVLAGLYPVQQGVARADNKSYLGIDDDVLRQRIGMVNQTPHIFETTLEENLRLAVTDASSHKLHQVIAMVGLEPLIASLPNGLSTVLDSRGVTLSGGEIKRIALARVILKDAPILLLDEPTEGLDPISEREVLRHILRWAQGRTLLWATHHLSNLDLVANLVVMDKGRLVDQGTVRNLTERSPWVQQMLRHQIVVLPSRN